MLKHISGGLYLRAGSQLMARIRAPSVQVPTLGSLGGWLDGCLGCLAALAALVALAAWQPAWPACPPARLPGWPACLPACLPTYLPAYLPALPCLALALPCLALPCLALPCLASPRLALPCLASPRLALPYLGKESSLQSAGLPAGLVGPVCGGWTIFTRVKVDSEPHVNTSKKRLQTQLAIQPTTRGRACAERNTPHSIQTSTMCLARL